MKIIPFIIISITIIIIVLSYRLKKNKLIKRWPITILRFFLPIISIGLFGQIFLFLTTLFVCEDGYMHMSKDVECRKGDLFFYHSIFVYVAIVFHVLIAFLTNSLYYKSLFCLTKSDVLQKTNSFSDLSLLLTKILINVLFIFDGHNKAGRWTILFFLMLITGSNLYIQLLFKTKLNLTLLLLNIIFSWLIFIGFYILFIGNLFQFLGFNGGIYLYFILVICTFFFILFYKNNEINFNLLNYKTINNANEYIYYILQYYRLIANKNNSRSYYTLLKSYIETNEESCSIIDCPLKLYMEKLKKGEDCEYLLYQYLDILYKYALSKFNHNIMIKINYAMFLMVRMNNAKQSIIVLNSINENTISFVRNYIKYLCTKIINKYISKENDYYINMNHKNKINRIKEYIAKVTKFYYDFWQLLYESKFQHSDNFTKLYEIGSKIMIFTNKIDDMYKLLIKEKSNNIEIYKLYSNFIENILKDEEKYQKIQNIKSSIFSDCFEIYENNYTNFSMEFFRQNDLTKYLLISANKNNVGTILDCSLGASAIFGYEKNELIGQHLNILLPDIIHKRHQEHLFNQAKNNNLVLVETQFLQKQYKPILIEGNFYGNLKSKFIKSFKIKIYFLKTEKNNLGFIVEILQDVPYMAELIKNRIINSNVDSRCCVLTNDNFIITSFTSNSVEKLGLSYKYIKSNNSIFPHIKELYDDYLSNINEIQKKENLHAETNYGLITSEDNIKINISSEIKKKIRDELINKKYNTKCQITWKINESNNNFEENYSKVSQSGFSFNFNKKKNEKNEKKLEVELLMEIKKCSIAKHLIGYYFYFSKLPSSESQTQNFFGYFKDPNNVEKEKDLKLMKYKVIIKPVQKDMSCSYINKLENQTKCPLPAFNSVIIKERTQKEEVPVAGELVVEDDFLPKTQVNFCFDINTMTYNIEKNYKKCDFIKSSLHREALTKIKEYKNYLKSLKKKKKKYEKLDSEEEEEETSESNEESNSSEIENESSKANSKGNSKIEKEKEEITTNDEPIYKTLSAKHKRESKIGIITTPSRKSSTIRAMKEIKNNRIKLIIQDDDGEKYNSNIPKKMQIKSNEDNYYKVNLNKIHYLIFDFNKDTILEEKNKTNSKIESILNSIKKNDIINKDEEYPSIALNISKEEKKKKKANNKILNDNNNANSQVNEGKSLLRKLKDAINSKNEEKSIRVLKIYSLVFSLTFIIIASAIIIINFNFYDELKGLLTTYKNIIFIKYCQTLSIYYVREQTLLNFNISNLGGAGIYTNIPAKDRNKYNNFIRSKLNEYLIETQDCLMQILSSSFSFSGYTLNNLTKSILVSQNFPFYLGEIRSDIISNLIQYNAALFNLASSFTPLTPLHPDMYNFMHNSFNIFYDAIVLTKDRYQIEFKKQKNHTLKLFIISIAVLLLLLIFVCFLMIISFISAVKTRTNYMKVFYGINIDLIRNLMANCEKLLETLQKNINKNNEEDIDSESIEKKSIAKNNNLDNNFRNKVLSNNSNQEKKVIISFNNKIYMICYIIFMTIISIFFPYNFYGLYDLCNKASNYANFFSDLNSFHSNIIDLFNAYRELLFNNKSIIQNMTASSYLNYKIAFSYEHLTREIDIIESFLAKNMNDVLVALFVRELCSFYLTDYFDSKEECNTKYSDLLKFPFEIFSTNFLQNLRSTINIVEYKFKSERILGNLESYEIDEWKTWEPISSKNETFRLDLFNNETLHAKFNIMFVNIILPYLDETRKIVINNLKIDGDKYNFILNFCLIIIFIVLIYLFYLFPMIRYLSNYIYKTKKMLLIIPMKIIATQGNIKSLFNIT